MLRLTQDIETIVRNVITSGEPQEIKDMYAPNGGDPAYWLTARWEEFPDGWYVKVESRYCDTGNIATYFVIYNTHLTSDEYKEYKQMLADKGFYPVESEKDRFASFMLD